MIKKLLVILCIFALCACSPGQTIELSKKNEYELILMLPNGEVITGIGDYQVFQTGGIVAEFEDGTIYRVDSINFAAKKINK